EPRPRKQLGGGLGDQRTAPRAGGTFPARGGVDRGLPRVLPGHAPPDRGAAPPARQGRELPAAVGPGAALRNCFKMASGGCQPPVRVNRGLTPPARRVFVTTAARTP